MAGATAAQGTLLPGDQLDRYLVEERLGEGAMGTVYRAFDTRLRRRVALKVLAAAGDGGAVSAALAEARASAAVHHPGVAAVFDAGAVEGVAFVVMELVPGATLRSRGGDSSIGVATRIRWLSDVAVALGYAHARGLVHRDVKPENVMVTDDGVVKVLDFGVARPVTVEGDVLASGAEGPAGTPAYMAPEQIRGLPPDARADQFSWGVTAYELLAGARPWPAARGTTALLAAILCDAPAPFPEEAGVPGPIVAAVLRALSKEPGDRFPSMDDVVAALAPHAAPWREALPSSPAEPSLPVEPAPSAAPVSEERPLPLPAVVPTPPAAPSFHEPDFSARVDVAAQIALLPPGATCKGFLLQSLVELGERAVPARELFALAGVAERRYLAFGNYPMRDDMLLAAAVARTLHRGVPLGEGLRRIGHAAFGAALASRLGKIAFGVFVGDAEQLLGQAAKVYPLVHGFGAFSTEQTRPGTYLFHLRDFPVFVETCQVGVIEAALRYVGQPGRIRVLMEALDRATIEVTLRDPTPSHEGPRPQARDAGRGSGGAGSPRK